MVAAGPTPTGDEVVINERLAGKLGVRPGDRVEVFAYGHSVAVVVRTVVPELGLAGLGGTQDGTVVTPIFVAPGTIDRLAPPVTDTPPAPAGGPRPAPPDAGQRFTAQPPAGLVFVSNTGDVFTGAERTAEVEAALKARLGDLSGVEVNLTKQGLLDQARRRGTMLTQTFSSIGYFSVAAGLLLLVNLFVMLSEERKTELGLLRAARFPAQPHHADLQPRRARIYSLAAAVAGRDRAASVWGGPSPARRRHLQLGQRGRACRTASWPNR